MSLKQDLTWCATSGDRELTITSRRAKTLLRRLELLDECTPHVFRQQHAGSHEQDRLDAKELWKRLKAARLVR